MKNSSRALAEYFWNPRISVKKDYILFYTFFQQIEHKVEEELKER